MFGRKFDLDAGGSRPPFFGARLFGRNVPGACDWSRAHTEQMDTKKFALNPHPLESEGKKRALEPTEAWKKHAVKIRRDLLQRSGSTDVKKVLRELEAKELIEKIDKDVKEDFIHDWRNWLAGIGKRSDYVKAGVPLTSVGQAKPLSRHPSVISFIDKLTGRVIDYYAEIANMKMRGPAVGRNGGPATLNDLWLYFKYVVRNEPINPEDFVHYNESIANNNNTLVGNQAGIYDSPNEAPSLADNAKSPYVGNTDEHTERVHPEDPQVRTNAADDVEEAREGRLREEEMSVAPAPTPKQPPPSAEPPRPPRAPSPELRDYFHEQEEEEKRKKASKAAKKSPDLKEKRKEQQKNSSGPSDVAGKTVPSDFAGFNRRIEVGGVMWAADKDDNWYRHNDDGTYTLAAASTKKQSAPSYSTAPVVEPAAPPKKQSPPVAAPAAFTLSAPAAPPKHTNVEELLKESHERELRLEKMIEETDAMWTRTEEILRARQERLPSNISTPAPSQPVVVQQQPMLPQGAPEAKKATVPRGRLPLSMGARPSAPPLPAPIDEDVARRRIEVATRRLAEREEQRKREEQERAYWDQQRAARAPTPLPFEEQQRVNESLGHLAAQQQQQQLIEGLPAALEAQKNVDMSQYWAKEAELVKERTLQLVPPAVREELRFDLEDVLQAAAERNNSLEEELKTAPEELQVEAAVVLPEEAVAEELEKRAEVSANPTEAAQLELVAEVYRQEAATNRPAFVEKLLGAVRQMGQAPPNITPMDRRSQFEKLSSAPQQQPAPPTAAEQLARSRSKAQTQAAQLGATKTTHVAVPRATERIFNAQQLGRLQLRETVRLAREHAKREAARPPVEPRLAPVKQRLDSFRDRLLNSPAAISRDYALASNAIMDHEDAKGYFFSKGQSLGLAEPERAKTIVEQAIAPPALDKLAKKAHLETKTPTAESKKIVMQLKENIAAQKLPEKVAEQLARATLSTYRELKGEASLSEAFTLAANMIAAPAA